MKHPHPRPTPRKTILLLAAACLCLSAVQAWAHAKLDHAQPPADGTVQQSPTEVRLSFNEEVETKSCRVQVLDATDHPVDKKDAHGDPNNPRDLIVSLSDPLAPGTYKVVWSAVAANTHVSNGEYTFRVEP